jgi:Serine dehydrogenase proteinase
MGAINDYISKRLKPAELEAELKSLIKEYNELTKNYLFIYCAAVSKEQNDISLQQEDYFIIHDLLYEVQGFDNIDFYIETPGGSGETAEEIVRFLHSKFIGHVNFVIAGEAKSAGTLIALGGNNISMTETGSLGPIDAQVFIGRTVVSAHDYMEWVDDKQRESAKNNNINPFDATIVAQINPGEIGSVYNALKFAIDLVEKWLCQYKFADWKVTESNQQKVTLEMKEERANTIATKLTNHSEWRSHGRSLKIEDLESLGLQIDNLDKDKPNVAKIIYRIKAVLMLLFLNTPVFKVFANDTSLIKKYARQQTIPDEQS